MKPAVRDRECPGSNDKLDWRPKIGFYGSRKPLSSKRIPQIYAELAKTDFASLYSTTEPQEDFAEIFAIYVHTVIMGQPYEIWVSSGDKVAVYEHCFATGRCVAKERLIFEFIQQLILTGQSTLGH